MAIEIVLRPSKADELPSPSEFGGRLAREYADAVRAALMAALERKEDSDDE